MMMKWQMILLSLLLFFDLLVTLTSMTAAVLHLPAVQRAVLLLFFVVPFLTLTSTLTTVVVFVSVVLPMPLLVPRPYFILA